MRRLTVILVALSFAACEYDVTLGRNRAAVTDGGSEGDAGVTPAPDAAVPVDAGTADAGADAGFDGGSDAGFDGGFDAGSVDSGSQDSGTDAGRDAGLDAAVPDAGAPDASMTVVDAGPPLVDLAIETRRVTVVEAGAAPTWDFSVTNFGPDTARGVVANVTLPAGFGAIAGTDCTVASSTSLSCAFADLDAGATGLVSFSLQAGGEYGWGDFAASVTSITAEADAGNNAIPLYVAQTDSSTLAVPLVAPQALTITACRGTNIATYALCVMGSTQMETYTFFPDGGLTDGVGFEGVWSQSSHQRNLAFRFWDTSTGLVQAGFVGSSVSAKCFEGVIDYGGVNYVGAWRACVP